MNKISPDFLIRSREAFASNRGMTLQHVRDRIAESAAGTVRRDLLSALDTAERLFGCALSQVPATANAVRILLASKSAAQLNISDKRYANVRSLLSAAVRDYGDAPQPITKRIPLTEEWQALLDRIEKRTYRMALYRLAAYCSFMTIPPEAVDRVVLLGFHEALEAEEIVKNPRRLLKFSISHWNMCRRQVPSWPAIILSSPFKKAPISQRLTAFPVAFQGDLECWRQRLLDPDVMDADAPRRKLRPVTVEGHVDQILRFASVLVQEGQATIDQITGLDALVEIKRYKAGLRFFLALPAKSRPPTLPEWQTCFG